MKLLFTFILISSVCFGQSKKEQIEGLNKTIDSLNTVLTTTRDKASKDIGGLNDKIKEISDEVTALKSDLTNLQTSNNKLTNENDKLKTDLGELSKKNLELEAKLKAIEVEKVSFKTVKIANLEVMTEDLGVMNWDDAKKACADLGDGWRLPTMDELNILYQNQDKIGGFAFNYYWSSTEVGFDGAWIQFFGDGPQANYGKGYTYYVRAIRAF